MTNIAYDRICLGNAYDTVDETLPTRRTIDTLPLYALAATFLLVLMLLCGVREGICDGDRSEDDASVFVFSSVLSW